MKEVIVFGVCHAGLTQSMADGRCSGLLQGILSLACVSDCVTQE